MLNHLWNLCCDCHLLSCMMPPPQALIFNNNSCSDKSTVYRLWAQSTSSNKASIPPRALATITSVDSHSPWIRQGKCGTLFLFTLLRVVILGIVMFRVPITPPFLFYPSFWFQAFFCLRTFHHFYNHSFELSIYQLLALIRIYFNRKHIYQCMNNTFVT